MAWLNVPNEWWSVNETYSSEPSGPGGQERSEGYHNLTLDPLLTDAQRQPSKIRITYSVSASVTGTDTYELSADYSLSATGMTSINESSDASSVVSASDTIERDLTLVDFFYSISLSVFAEAYGSDCYATAGSAVISAVEFYYEGADECVPRWTSYIDTTEECQEV